MITLLLGAGLGVLRSGRDPDRDPAGRLAAELSCPSCQGESVASSDSALAVSMRTVIAQRLAAGQTPEQIRSWFVRRYGPNILTDPPKRGPGLLLWVVPAAVLAFGLLRATRRRPAPAQRLLAPARRLRAPTQRLGSGSAPGTRNRIWNLVAGALVAMVALIAVTGTGSASPQPEAIAASPGRGDSVAQVLEVGWSLERQGRFENAIEMYRAALRKLSDDRIRIRLAYAQLRAQRPGAAAQTAAGVLATNPSSADALLLLGLAQRAMNSTQAAATLNQFLTRFPQHPAAPEVRRLLAGNESTTAR